MVVSKARLRNVLVLGYHGVSRDWPEPLTVTPSALAAGLESLLARGWVGTTFTAAVRDGGTRRMLAATFDDAYHSVIEHAYPVLKRLGIPGTVFVPTAYADGADLLTFGALGCWTKTQWREELRCMAWDELRELRSAGWEIGSHTETHPRLSQLDDEALARELSGSKSRCEAELGVPCTALAYPFSDLTPHVTKAAEEAGYEAATTVAVGLARSARPLFEWPRVGVYRQDDRLRLRLKTSPTIRAAGGCLRRASSSR
jgi:peptidoglycan/xylan/chitin deacetylase (PgdA/CDA1 family)